MAETRRHGDATELAERFGASQISSTAKIVEVDTAAHTITAERDLERGTEALRAAAQPGDLIITVGAGDIYKAGEKLLREN